MAQGLHSLDPAVLDRLASLELVARSVVDGFMSGGHRSGRLGSSVEFAQHRPYVIGDELRRVDWRVYARNDRLVVKQFVEETDFACHLLVDRSESMQYGSEAWTKFDYARWCAASLAHLVLQQGDTAGLVLFDESSHDKVPPKHGLGQRAAIFDALERATCGGGTKIGSVLEWIAPKLRQKGKGVVCLFSDFYDEPAAIGAGLRRLAAGAHDLVLFQVRDKQERDFAFDGLLRLDGLEGAGKVKVDPRALREAYLAEVAAHDEALAREARALGAEVVQLSTDRGVEVVLSAWLSARTARIRRGGGGR
jgi:uncharacterized protein (DUF58 family)